MLKIALIDNNNEFLEMFEFFIFEKLNKELLNFSIQKFNDETIFLKNFNSNSTFDYIFLDYSLAKIDGKILGKLIRDKNADLKLIYVTENIEAIFSCIENGIFRLINKSNFENELTDCITSIIKELKSLKATHIFNTEKGKIPVIIDNILMFEYINRSVYMTTSIGEVRLISTSLFQVFDNLENYNFIYVCRGILVNLNHVKLIHKNLITLKNGTTILISRRKVKEVTTSFHNFLQLNK